MGFGTKDMSLRAFTPNRYRPPASRVRSAACLTTRGSAADDGKSPGRAACGIGFMLSNSLLIIIGALAGSCGVILSAIVRKAAVACSLRRSHQQRTVSYAAGSRAAAAFFEFPCHFPATSLLAFDLVP